MPDINYVNMAKMGVVRFFKSLLKKINIGVTSYSNLNELNQFKTDYFDLLELSRSKIDKLTDYKALSKAQLYQDLFVLHELNFKENGYFVEFGATNGFTFSNTYLLEKSFNWTGILAEPAMSWHKELRDNRECHIETKCVWSKSNEKLLFNENKTKELSTLQQFSNNDFTNGIVDQPKTYEVHTISFIDMLDSYGAPKLIDYLSIDTEGSEFTILENFDFTKYSFKVITCEHNFSEDREKICKLLESKGYRRKFKSISKWDDWYVLK